MSENVGKDGLLAFLGLYQTLSNDGFIGAVLVTDTQGIPESLHARNVIGCYTSSRPLLFLVGNCLAASSNCLT